MLEYLLSAVYMSGTLLNVLQLYDTEIIITSYGNDYELLTKYSYTPLHYLAAFSVDSGHSTGLWLMGYKKCKILPVLMGSFSPLFPFYVTL